MIDDWICRNIFWIKVVGATIVAVCVIFNILVKAGWLG